VNPVSPEAGCFKGFGEVTWRGWKRERNFSGSGAGEDLVLIGLNGIELNQQSFTSPRLYIPDVASIFFSLREFKSAKRVDD
jgi:hypothetical protein